MAKTKIKYNKLVRDRIPTILISKDKLFKAKQITDEEYLVALTNKLSEETSEVVEACQDFIKIKSIVPYESQEEYDDSRKKVVEEMGDLMEVFLTMVKKYRIRPSEIKAIMSEKKTKNGGFDDGIFLEWVENE